MRNLAAMLSKTLCLLLCAGLIGVPPAAGAADYRIETVAEGLAHPWSLAFLPDGRMLVTERAGRLRVIEDGVLLESPVEGVPEAYVRGQAGLFEVLPDPDFEDNRWIYLSLAHGTGRANSTRVVRGRLEGMVLREVEVLFTAEPARRTSAHYGGRMAFLADGTLVVGLGDGQSFREEAQRLDSHTGTIVRVARDGSVPPDNPFVGRDDALPEIYSYGHRNVQGLVFDAEGGVLWAHEHGPRGGDELNRIEPGENYGWPAATFGVEYYGARITPHTSRPGMRDPVLHWTPSIAPGGMTLCRGSQFPAWQGNLLVAALAHRQVRRVMLEGAELQEQETLFAEIGERLRDIRVGPDGALYLLTDTPRGRVLRISADDRTLGSAKITDGRSIDDDVQGVVHDDQQPGGHPLWRFRRIARLAAFGPAASPRPRPVLQPDDVARQPPAVEHEMGSGDDEQRGRIPGQEQKGQGIDRDVRERGQVAASFLAHHPLALQKIVADGVRDELVGGDHGYSPR
jgi:glucose/arabinose dehydrogenase